MKLTEHFTLEIFEYSPIAICRGIDNHVPDNYIQSLKTLCSECLEPLRLEIKEPVFILSGFRCHTLNLIFGGSENSQHLFGEAVDIYYPDNLKLSQMFEILKERANFDQLILRRTHESCSNCWIHVSCKKNPNQNRRQVLYV